mmetsp:Transcript_114356/g.356097  ORF Transcript_114356/g.356097 Transcript_114356/m.356097 type:complete len:148 (-) Transcript_114356:13-456(-)
MSEIVVIAVCRGEPSRSAFDWAVSHFPRDSTVFHLLHVSGDDALSQHISTPTDQKVHDREAYWARFDVGPYVKEAKDRKLTFDCHVIKEDETRGKVIVERASELQATALVVGSKGRTGLQRLLLGNTSDYCSHHAPCPVVIVRQFYK